MGEVMNALLDNLREKRSEVNRMRSSEILKKAADSAEAGELAAEAVTSFGRKAIRGTAVGVVVASILVGLTFSGTAEITAEQTVPQINQPPVVMDIGDYGNAEIDDDDDDVAEQKNRKVSFVARFKQALLSLPQGVRLVVIAPLWVLGNGILTAIAVLWRTLFASPLGGIIMSFAAGFAILLGLFAVTAKVLFPEIPLRKIITKKNALIVALVAAGMSVLDAVAPMFWHQYPFVAGLTKVIIGAGLVAFLTMRVRMVFYRDKYRNMPQAAY